MASVKPRELELSDTVTARDSHFPLHGRYDDRFRPVVDAFIANFREEEELGVRCIGVPVFGHDGIIIAAVSVSGTTEQIVSENCESIASLLRAAAREISASLQSSEEAAA